MKLSSKMMIAAAVLAIASTASGVSAQTSKAINPTTGRDCVQEVDAIEDGNHVRYTYRNSCGSSFSISIYVNGRSTYGGYIEPYKDRIFTVTRADAQGDLEWSYE